MTAPSPLRGLAAGALVLGAGLLLKTTLFAEKDPAGADRPRAGATDRLGGADRHLTHVSTDKPIYRAGEKVYVRGVVLRADDRRPLGRDQRLSALVEIKGPKGETVASGWARGEESVVAFAWDVPDGQAGGRYTVKVSHPSTGEAPGERTFEVRSYRAPRLKHQIEFVRDGYGPGDAVSAACSVERAEGGIPAGARVTVIARVDGDQVHQGETTVGPDGNCFARFDLPKQIARGDGTLAFVIKDGGTVETASKTIPILLQTVDLGLFPEGGDLVAGLENRLYLEAKTPTQKPADIAGVIVDSTGEQVAEFRTEHEGRGRVSFTPAAGQKYEMRITEPSGIKTVYALPEVKGEGIVLRSPADVSEAGEPIRLQVAASSPTKVRVTLSRREKEVSSARLSLEANRPRRVELTPPETADGVLIATVWDAEGRPLAERLIFRRPVETLNVSIEPDQPRYVPGGKARLKIKTTDSKGRPVGGVVGVTVTDDSVLEMIEKREQAPRLPVMVFLESDVRELADAHVYLDDKNPQAPQALDLLLGTQGWRRFATVDPAKFIAEHGEAARRVLALKVPSPFERRLGARWRFEKFEARNGAEFDFFALPAAAAEPLREGKWDKDDDKLDPAAKRAPASGPPLKKPAARAGGFPRQNAQEELEQALKQLEAGARDRRVIAGGFGDIAGGHPMAFAYVRQYAHQARPDRKPGERVDFTETLFWHAGLRTDEKTGEATVSFDLSDAVSSFRATADAFSGSGSLGAGTTTVESVEPFYAEPKLPLEVTSGDLIRLPLGLVNNTSQPLAEALLRLEAKGIGTAKIGPFDLAAEERVRRIVDLEIGSFSGEAEIILGATAGPYRDQVTRKLLVQPLGFPIEIAAGGLIEADGEISRELVIPGHVVPGSLKSKVEVFPTPLANMTAALERLIVDPNGCFEQTSSTNYPLVMAQQYFQSHAGIDPALIQRANEKLDKGYDRLVSFECKERGYEWFGQDPGHEALTAYGLMQFKDMAEIRSVDPAMLERTRKWVLAQRDGEGGFKRERRGLHTWVADKDVSNAYITWTLLSAGEKDLDQEVATVKRAAAETKNSYVVALAANVLALAGDKDGARRLRDRLVTLQAADGSINGATTSIVGSGGDALAIETTSLAALAWLSDPDQFGFADKAVRYLAESCKAGRFGSTQSTVLALKAIVGHAKVTAKPKAPGRLHLLVDGKLVGEPVAFDPKTQGALELPEIGSLLTPGRHTVTVRMEDGSRMPCAIAVNLYSTKPAGSDACQVDLAVGIKERDLTEGGITEAQVTVTNRSDEPVPTPVAIIGLPGGLEVRHDQLKELVKSGRIAAYEVLGREVVLYWRSLAGNQEVHLPLSLVAALPGRYTGPASRAYLYYTDEHKRWVDPLEVTIAPRE